ncbi:MAG: hypothetical protein F7B59_03520 [Desulfurococcales archaeon]|nr:hypothetical protein [Desulfurococcales archaeon]
MDTRNDYRILLALDAYDRLEKRVRSWVLPWPIEKGKAMNALSGIHKDLLKLRFSFLPYRMILESQELNDLVSEARLLYSLLFPRESSSIHVPAKGVHAVAEVKYALSILLGLPSRIRLGDDNVPEHAVDILGAEVVDVDELGEGLKETRASTGSFALTVVTNIGDIRKGQVRAIAILPPVEFRGVVSEAMYASDVISSELIGKRVGVDLVDRHVRAIVIDIARNIR